MEADLVKLEICSVFLLSVHLCGVRYGYPKNTPTPVIAHIHNKSEFGVFPELILIPLIRVLATTYICKMLQYYSRRAKRDM